jgi:hypothetical protein
MATGGIFQLITNDGKQDRMLMASDLLAQRLAAISAARAASPQQLDPTPTLLDIEKTHILFTNAHFKPFAAIGFEYNVTNPQSGNAALGSQVTFSIPQFGDFFYDMVVYVSLLQPTLTVAAGTSASDSPLMRWCAYPGERIFDSVSFQVNGNPLDQYYSSDVNFNREFMITPNKKSAWDRCVGQEQPELGFVDQPNWASSGVAASSIVSRVMTQTVSGDQTPTGQKPVSVLKELLVPLLFWCNRDVRLAVPSVAIPYGQRFITLQLTQPQNLVGLVPRGAGGWTDATINGSLNYANMLQSIQLYINNIFVNPEVHNIFIKRIGFTLIRVHRNQTTATNTSTGQILLQQLKWPIETLFVGMRMSDYNSSDTTLTRQHLDKWHTFSQITPTSRSAQGWVAGQVTLKNSAYALPASTTLKLSAGLSASLQLVDGTSTPPAGTNNFTALSSGDIVTLNLTGVSSPAKTATIVATVSSVVPAISTTVPGYVQFKELVGSFGQGIVDVVLTSATASVQGVSTSGAQTSTVFVPSRTVDTVTITAHGIPIYNGFSNKFYSAYIPYQFGGPNITSPTDIGALMIPFNLYPGTYQPSGHINVSRAREFYINYTSSVITSAVNGILLVSASAINFLLISDGSAVLRYST